MIRLLITIITLLIFCFAGCQSGSVKDQMAFRTFCNPLNLSYRFSKDEPSRREAADPTIVHFNDRYYLFASKSGGYWHSDNLIEWTFIKTNEIPVEEYAPTVIAINDVLYFLASSNAQSTIYKTTDPLSGKWSIAKEELDMPVWDPAFFMFDDDRLYLFWGCSNVNPLFGVELDYSDNFSFIGEPKELIYANPHRYGWEVPGDYNTLTEQSPWIEGAWMNKYDGRYYLQYAGPGTEFKSYANAVYIAENPLGPYELQLHNPVVYKPEGFAAGAGHGSTIQDEYGNYWHFGTITISMKHIFERRLGLYPLFFDEDSTLHSITRFGDYPLIMPEKKISGFEDIFPGWMLLSCDKKTEVSSSVDSHPASNITDEDIRTYWAAESGEPGEYAVIDLGELYDVFAIQINFAEHNTEILGRQENLFHRYTIEHSEDVVDWEMLIDKSDNRNDNSHDYLQLAEKVTCRFLRITNIEVPDGHFAISGFRVFGKGDGKAPGRITTMTAKRNSENGRSVQLIWEKSDNATGYNISFGIDENKLYHNYIVYQDSTLTINTLDAGRKYYFTIESFNENGITPSGIIISAE
jgi:xylan 1,4-beta-xylosidase